jgi:acyl-coenzyme A thioesterase PaaI-like protein
MSAEHTDVELDPEPGWAELPQIPEDKRPRSFVSSDPTGDRLRVRYYRRESDGAMVGKVWFGPGAEGPPGCAHGGSMAAVLDEAMGGAAWISGNIVLAARLTVEFRRMLPLDTVATVEASVASVNGRKLQVRSRLLTTDAKVVCEAEGLFVAVDPRRLGDLGELASKGDFSLP